MYRIILLTLGVIFGIIIGSFVQLHAQEGVLGAACKPVEWVMFQSQLLSQQTGSSIQLGTVKDIEYGYKVIDRLAQNTNNEAPDHNTYNSVMLMASNDDDVPVRLYLMKDGCLVSYIETDQTTVLKVVKDLEINKGI